MAYETATNFVINDIMRKGGQILYQNYLQKHKAPGFAADDFVDFTDQLLMQTGVKQQRFQHIRLDNKPNPIKRQSLNTQSLKKVQRKRQNQQNWDLASPRTRRTNSNLFQKRASMKFSNTQLIRKRSTLKEQKFVSLAAPKDKKELENIKKQQEQQDKIRAKLIDTQQRNKLLDKQMFEIQKSKLQREKQLQQDYERKMSDHDNSFAFDTNGQIFYYSIHKNNESRGRHYPPRTKYQVQKDDDHQNNQKLSKKEKYVYQKIKAAQGNAFASCVMKTMNVSQISMNATMKDTDPQSFMKRNDLFNNNHSRQTSSIPYMHLNAGTAYTQKQTNTTVANLQQSTIQRTNSYFTKASGMRKYTQNEKVNKSYTAPKSAKVSAVHEKDIYEKRDIKTGQPSTRRTYSLRRPRTSNLTGRIMTNNEQLVQQLFC